MATGGKREGAGRKKGSKSKRTIELEELLAVKFPGYHPVIQMAEIANDVSLEPSLRLQAAKEVAQYVAPKLKAIEHSGNVEPVAFVISWQDAQIL